MNKAVVNMSDGTVLVVELSADEVEQLTTPHPSPEPVLTPEQLRIAELEADRDTLQSAVSTLTLQLMLMKGGAA